MAKLINKQGTNQWLLWLTEYLCNLWAALLQSIRQYENSTVSNGVCGHHDHGHRWPRWPQVGRVLYQALPLLQFFVYARTKKREKEESLDNICLRRKGEREPGNEAIILLSSSGSWCIKSCTHAQGGIKQSVLHCICLLSVSTNLAKCGSLYFGHWICYTLMPYVIVISRAQGMYGIYCTEARGRLHPRALAPEGRGQ